MNYSINVSLDEDVARKIAGAIFSLGNKAYGVQFYGIWGRGLTPQALGKWCILKGEEVFVRRVMEKAGFFSWNGRTYGDLKPNEVDAAIVAAGGV